MPMIERLEARLGRFAIPGLLQAIAILKLLAFILTLMLPPETLGAYLGLLSLDPAAVKSGEIWRILTSVLIPDTNNVLLAFLATWFLIFLGRSLDEAWGAFRVNLYILVGLILQAATSLWMGGSADNGIWLYSTALLAVACIYPNEEILLFFVVPVKLKWIAWMWVAWLVIQVFRTPYLFPIGVVAHLNFLLAFGPGFFRERVHFAKVAKRRDRFQQEQAPEHNFFFKCSVCGKTDLDDHTLEFRVTDEGEEVCSQCRALRKAT